MTATQTAGGSVTSIQATTSGTQRTAASAGSTQPDSNQPDSAPGEPAGGEPTRVRIAIIGAGFSGLGMAIRLKQVGIDDFVLLERAGDIGGTWRDNAYPGAAVDVRSHLYSYSFAPNPEWSAVYAPADEIWGYITRVSAEHGVLEHVRCHTEVIGGDWEEATHRWQLHTSTGQVEARFVISGMGPLSNPVPPQIPGLENFEGRTFHSARWDHEHDLTGERVGVIGTGSSAAQFVPAIQPQVGELTVFQRTPHWTFPRLNRRITRLERAIYRRFPAAQRLARARQYYYHELFGYLLQSPKPLEVISRLRMRLQVSDRGLRQKLTPGYRMGCKRVVITDDFHPALAAPNSTVVTEGIREITPKGVRTEDGTEHELDTLVLGTGFEVMPIADPLRGREGDSLAERWAHSRAAYRGTTVAGFPNYFMLVGPNTATGHTSILLYAEPQIDYIVDTLRYLEHQDVSSVEVRQDVQETYNAELARRLANSVWTTGGCASWYLDANGSSAALWPGHTGEFRKALRRFDPQDYVLRTGAAVRA